MVNYALNRSRRKTVAIYIRNGSVEVRAPFKCPKPEIDSFVMSKESWINEKLQISKKQAEKKKAFALDYVEKILFRGEEYPIAERTNTQTDFDGGCFYLPPKLEPELIKDICIKLYRRLAKSHISERVAVYAELMGVAPTAVKINGANTRWGSCSSRKSLNFSWRLIMANDDVIDYVVIHELAHLIHMNHSEKFWAVVASVLPNYKERQSQLRKLRKRLNTEDWN